MTEPSHAYPQGGAVAQTRVRLRRRPVAEQRDIYQAKLVRAVAALQQITWHIGCSVNARGKLGLFNVYGQAISEV